MSHNVEAPDLDNIKVENDSHFEEWVEGKINPSMRKKVFPIMILAISMALFHVYTSAFGILEAWQQRSVTVSFVLLLVPFLFPFKHTSTPFARFIDAAYFLGAAVAIGYVFTAYPEITYREGEPNQADIFFGSLLVLLILEGTRRAVGKAMAILVSLLIAYVFLGKYVPGTLGHPGFTVEKAIDTYFNSTFGMFGLIMGAMSNYIIMFIIFGAFLSKSHAGQFFIKIAYALTGSKVGGPAKVAVLASGLMGMISGNAVSNVVTTGTLTIPLMKKVGYKGHFAGAVEAAASAGGQIMPPIMGAAAFIIASNLQLPYIQLCLFALVPGVLHFVAIYFMVHFEAKKHNLTGLPKDQLPNVKKVFKEGWFLFLPIILIIGMLVMGYSPQIAGVYSLVSIIVVSMFRRKTRMTWKQVIGSLEIGARNSVSIAIICAAAGILIGSINLTGLGMKFSSLVLGVTGENLLISLVFIMIASIILGMGMPTVSAYVILSVLGVPALVKLGVNPIAAHLFVFYFAIMSNLTPPVAVGAYAAAALAQSDPSKTGFTGLKISLGTFLIPFIFVYGPALLMQGSVPSIVLAVITAFIGIYSFTAGMQGFMLVRMTKMERAMAIIGALTLIIPGLWTDVLGIALFTLTGLIQYRNKKSNESQFHFTSAS
ncbi:TRAP transporter permease [Ammoniphilus sp. CFH 90114]|uniref:TRAP transporter permease n=1 Tax=Ammoniphilus sp. CFH 90114 TaxID=2493665 RepID=UPI00100FEE09|nr:TRAP transporter permease [Ammoniphilus sp. CFH 90114]RXT02374.1 TRAP transporter permease [Ammoniphilus sp. CFH 90114]